MLVLTRKAKQSIQVGPNITITILQIKGQAVRVGIEAPRDVCVLRTELAPKLSNSQDATVLAALKKVAREAAISSAPEHEDRDGRTMVSASGSLRCRAPRVEAAPVNSSYPSAGPASFIRPRRRRVTMQ